MTAQTRSEIAALLDKHGLSPSRRLGQHFLADGNITRKIVQLAGVVRGTPVVEIGAGTGTLTRALAAAGGRVVSYEVDERLRPVLLEVTKGLDVDLRFEDASKLDLGEALSGDGWSFISNLPYNVGTPILLKTLRTTPQVTRFVVMVQKEVAERLVAEPGGKSFGLPSVVVALHGRASRAFDVPPQVFLPPPNVESAVVLIERTDASPDSERAIEIAGAAFRQRRKMLRGSLAGVLSDAEAALEDAGLSPTARAEDLSADDYLRLAQS